MSNQVTFWQEISSYSGYRDFQIIRRISVPLKRLGVKFGDLLAMQWTLLRSNDPQSFALPVSTFKILKKLGVSKLADVITSGCRLDCTGATTTNDETNDADPAVTVEVMIDFMRAVFYAADRRLSPPLPAVPISAEEEESPVVENSSILENASWLEINKPQHGYSGKRKKRVRGQKSTRASQKIQDPVVPPPPCEETTRRRESLSKPIRTFPSASGLTKFDVSFSLRSGHQSVFQPYFDNLINDIRNQNWVENDDQSFEAVLLKGILSEIQPLHSPDVHPNDHKKWAEQIETLMCRTGLEQKSQIAFAKALLAAWETYVIEIATNLSSYEAIFLPETESNHLKPDNTDDLSTKVVPQTDDDQAKIKPDARSPTSSTQKTKQPDVKISTSQDYLGPAVHNKSLDQYYDDLEEDDDLEFHVLEPMIEFESEVDFFRDSLGHEPTLILLSEFIGACLSYSPTLVTNRLFERLFAEVFDPFLETVTDSQWDEQAAPRRFSDPKAIEIRCILATCLCYGLFIMGNQYGQDAMCNSVSGSAET